jgi:hypothetical protein
VAANLRRSKFKTNQTSKSLLPVNLSQRSLERKFKRRNSVS